MTRRQLGMVEIVNRIVRHAELFHDAAGGPVGGNREGYDFCSAQTFKCVLRHTARPFRRQASIPMLRRQSPPNLDAGSEVRLEVRNRQADESDESTIETQLGREQPKSVAAEMRLDPVQQEIALLARK